MKLREIINGMGLGPGERTFVRTIVRTHLDDPVELVIGREEERVILTIGGREAVNMTFGELEGYVNGRSEDGSGLAGDAGAAAGDSGVAGTGAA